MVSDKWWIVQTFLDDDFTTQETGPLTAPDSTVNLLNMLPSIKPDKMFKSESKFYLYGYQFKSLR